VGHRSAALLTCRREAVVQQGISIAPRDGLASNTIIRWRRTSRLCGAAGEQLTGHDQDEPFDGYGFAFRVIGFRASDAVVMAGLRDLISHDGGRASAAAPMAG
jgi:hypothetical protein